MIKSLYKFIFNKTTQFFLISFSLFFLLKNPIEILLSNTIVKYIFENIDYKWYFDLILLGVLFAGFILTWHRYKIRYIPSKGITYGLIVISIIYLCYRLSPSKWIFEPLQYTPFIKYFDVIFFILACQLFLHIRHIRKYIKQKWRYVINYIKIGNKKEPTPSKKQPLRENKQNSFLNDKPISKVDDDKLGYNTYAEEIGNKILSSHFDKSFAIGINGQWGHGKSSFINLIKKKVKGDNIIEVNFNPWDNHSPEAIIRNFFDKVQDAVRPYHSSLSSLFTQYSDELLALENNTITRSIQTLLVKITDFDSEDSLYDEINTALKDIDKKLVVYIDDLDRLDSKEIIEVIRLIRNTADFYNTFFVVAYDRNYLIEALKKYNHYKEEKFLEKIFQLEVTLPYFDRTILKYQLGEILKERLPHILHQDIEKNISRFTLNRANILDEWLDNIRDVTRLSNSILLNINRLVNEVDFSDFINLELIRLKYPSAYIVIHQERERFFEIITEHDNSYYKLKDLQENSRQKYQSKPIYTVLHAYLYENCDELSIPIENVQKIVNVLMRVFIVNRFGQHLLHSHSPLSIIYPNKFQRYFKYSLSEGELSNLDFEEARIKPQEEFNKKISVWAGEGMAYEIMRKLSEIKTFENKKDFEKTIRAIFYLANLPAKNGEVAFANNIVGYSPKDIIAKINLYESYYQYDEDKRKELKTFVQSIFQNAIAPFTFESFVLKQINKEYDSFLLSKNETMEMCVCYLKKYINTSPKLNSNTWRLYDNCKYTELVPNGNTWISKENQVPNKAKEIMLNFLLNVDFDGFLSNLVTIQTTGKDKHQFRTSEIILELFEDWSSFTKILDEKSEADYKHLREFKDFYTKCGDKGYSQYIEYRFKDIPISHRLPKTDSV